MSDDAHPDRPDPASVVTGFIRAIERGDLDAATAHLHPEVSYENMPITPIVGAEAVATALRSFLDPASEVDWRILRQETVGRVVFNERLDRFRIGAGWLELPVAGVFELDGDDRITLWRDYFDLGSFQRQLEELTGGA
ncbi:MAG: limonene-1,2-epoxide hydrolase family protein [Ilumatobacteraceae bacterium]